MMKALYKPLDETYVKSLAYILTDEMEGRAEGYRAWTRKRNFPEDPRGRWQVQVLAADDRMIGTLRFRVE